MSRPGISIEIKGLNALRARLDTAVQKVEREVGVAIVESAVEVKAEAARLVQQPPKTGAVYTDIFRRIGGRAVPVESRAGRNLSASHQASAVGEAPATDTGNLASGIRYRLSREDGMIRAEVESSAPYSAALEAPHSARNKAGGRPFLTRAVRALRERILARLRRAVARGTREAGGNP